jgi:hypothetical protein
VPDTDRIAAIVEQHHDARGRAGYPAGLIPHPTIPDRGAIVAAATSSRRWSPALLPTPGPRSAEAPPRLACCSPGPPGTRGTRVVDCILALLRSRAGGARLGLAPCASQVQFSPRPRDPVP